MLLRLHSQTFSDIIRRGASSSMLPPHCILRLVTWEARRSELSVVGRVQADMKVQEAEMEEVRLDAEPMCTRTNGGFQIFTHRIGDETHVYKN